jgi:hypothetical protein
MTLKHSRTVEIVDLSKRVNLPLSLVLPVLQGLVDEFPHFLDSSALDKPGPMTGVSTEFHLKITGLNYKLGEVSKKNS